MIKKSYIQKYGFDFGLIGIKIKKKNTDTNAKKNSLNKKVINTYFDNVFVIMVRPIIIWIKFIIYLLITKSD